MAGIPEPQDRIGFSPVLYEGGSVAELDACAREHVVEAVYVLDGGEWV